MRALADQLDQEAWQAEGAGDEKRYELLFRRARAVSALSFALRGETAESIYEAAHAFETPEDLVALLRSE